MTNKRWLFAVGLLTLAGITIGVSAFLPAGPGVSRANFERIENGMTRDQVEAIIGKAIHSPNPRGRSVTWWADGESIFVLFDANDQVERAGYRNDGRNFVQKLWDRRPWRQLPPPTEVAQ